MLLQRRRSGVSLASLAAQCLRSAAVFSKFLVWQVLKRDFTYARKYFLLLAHHVGVFGRGAELSLAGSLLTKRYPWPYSERWTVTVSDLEKRLLHYLYVPRSRQDLTNEFGGETRSAVEIATLLRRHLGLGSIIEVGDRYMGVFSLRSTDDVERCLSTAESAV